VNPAAQPPRIPGRRLPQPLFAVFSALPPECEKATAFRVIFSSAFLKKTHIPHRNDGLPKSSYPSGASWTLFAGFGNRERFKDEADTRAG
jgi:hypothetical protein